MKPNRSERELNFISQNVEINASMILRVGSGKTATDVILWRQELSSPVVDYLVGQLKELDR